MGKAYANKKTLEERNKNEYYPTPKVLVVELEKLNLIKKTDKVLEPCCGEAKQISGYFNSLGYDFEEKDLIYGFHSVISFGGVISFQAITFTSLFPQNHLPELNS